MRILVVHNTLNDSRSVSGVLRHYAWMANAWIADGHPTDFMVARAGFAQVRNLAPKAGLVCSDRFFDATEHISQTWRYLPAYGYRLLSPHWVRLPQPYDVVYASGQFIVEVYGARVLARRSGAKLAVKIQHVLKAQRRAATFFDWLFLQAEKLSVHMINRHADLLMCLSPPVAADYEALSHELGSEPKKAHVIGCGIDLSLFGSETPAGKEYDAVFLGRLHQHKGAFDLPVVWQQITQALPLAKLLVIGEGPHREHVAQAMADLRLSASVTFTGGISESEKISLLGMSRVGLSLSYEEGWGLSVTEFLASGLPVVAYQLPVFEHAFPGLLESVAPGHQSEFAQKVVALLKDPIRATNRGAQGREFVQRYDYRSVAREELSLLQSVLPSPNGSDTPFERKR